MTNENQNATAQSELNGEADSTIIKRKFTVEQQLYYDLRVPESDVKVARPLLLALHGYGGSKRQMMREAVQLAPLGFVIASVQGVHQHFREPRTKDAPLKRGFGWLTSFEPQDSIRLHQYVLQRIVDDLSDEGLVNRSQVFLLGFSQSCALNYRFALTHTDVLRGVIGVCGGVPGDLETNEIYRQTDARILHLSGERDEFYPPATVASYRTRLQTFAKHEIKMKAYIDAGHFITAAMREDVREWLSAQAIV